MEFILNRNPENRTQQIPYAAMQIAGLASAEELMIQADAGSILMSRKDITSRQAITMITHLYEVIDGLMLQLVDTSNEAASTLEEIPDLLDELDEVVLDDLLANGADPDGLRLLLAQEDEEDEE